MKGFWCKHWRSASKIRVIHSFHNFFIHKKTEISTEKCFFLCLYGAIIAITEREENGKDTALGRNRLQAQRHKSGFRLHIRSAVVALRESGRLLTPLIQRDRTDKHAVLQIKPNRLLSFRVATTKPVIATHIANKL